MAQATRWSRFGRVLLVAAAALGASASLTPAQAQFFGQNQVQYDRMDWRVIET